MAASITSDGQSALLGEGVFQPVGGARDGSENLLTGEEVSEVTSKEVSEEVEAEAVVEAEDDVYTVERILDHKGGKFLVRWAGFGPSHDSWEPSANILDHELIAEYRRERTAARQASGVESAQQQSSSQQSQLSQGSKRAPAIQKPTRSPSRSQAHDDDRDDDVVDAEGAVEELPHRHVAHPPAEGASEAHIAAAAFEAVLGTAVERAEEYAATRLECARSAAELLARAQELVAVCDKPNLRSHGAASKASAALRELVAAADGDAAEAVGEARAVRSKFQKTRPE